MRYVFSQRSDGELVLRESHLVGDISEDRLRFFTENKVDLLVEGLVAHRVKVALVKEIPSKNRFFVGYDSIVATVPVSLALPNADCYTVLLQDGAVRAIAHCSRKSFSCDVLTRTIQQMLECGARSPQMDVVIGPGLCVQCHAVEKSFLLKECHGGIMPHYLENAADKKCYVDMPQSIIDLLCRWGVRMSRITNIDECTKCTHTADGRKKYFSCRGDGWSAGGDRINNLSVLL